MYIERKLLNPKNDYVFKRIFGYKGNENLTKSLLNSILTEKIESLEIESNEVLEQDLMDDKVGILDIYAKFSDNTMCDIEMQIVDHKNIEKRMLFYWSKMYTQSIKKNKDYDNLKKCIVVVFLDYELEKLKEIEKYISIWNIREKSFPEYILTNDLELYIIEMSKYEKMTKGIIPKENAWIDFINKIEVDMENEDIKQAKEVLEEISSNKRERRLAELREKHIMDTKAVYDRGIEIGIEQGIEQGIVQGKEIGKKEKSLEIAKKMKKAQIEVETIIEITNLTKEEIEKL